MGIFFRRRTGHTKNRAKNRQVTREALRAEAFRPALFETLEPRLLLDGGPTAANDPFTVQEDSIPAFIDVLLNDVGEGLEVIGVGETDNATVTWDATGLDYQPDPDFQGPDTFTYTIKDGEDNEATGNVTVNVLNVNDFPTAVDDTALLNSGQTMLNIAPLDNDIYAPDPLETFTIESFTQGAFGTITKVGETLVYTLNEGVEFPGEDTFTYTINDHQTDGVPDGLTSTATVTILDRPVAVDDEYTVENESSLLEDSTDNDLNVLANDTPTGETFTITSVTGAQHGTATIGVSTDDGTTPIILYTPEADFQGTETLTYTVEDADGITAEADVTIEVTNVNDAPEAVNDVVALDGDATSVAIHPLANDSDVDPADTLTISSYDHAATYGTVVKDGDTLTYTLNDGVTFPGRDTFEYTVSDGNGGETTATVIISQTPTPADDARTVNEDSTGNELDVLTNDTPVGETFTITGVTGALHGTATVGVAAGDGTTPILLYTPVADFQGTETLTYTVQDADGLTNTATVTVTVENVNDAPVAKDDTAIMDYDQADIEIDALANDYDVDPNDSPTIKADGFTQGAKGTVELVTDPETGDQTFTYTPGAEFDGEDTFTYTIIDSQGLEATATVTVRMKPGAVDDTADMEEDAKNENDEAIPVTIDVLANDEAKDASGELTVSAFTQGGDGLVELVTDPDTGEQTLTYLPDANFYGVDMFTYTIQDANGLEATATVTVSVNAVNDDPVVTQEFAGINVNRNADAAIFDLAKHFADPDIPLLYRFTSNLGTFDVLMYQFQTPITVTNFQRYADAGDYVSSFIHRSVAGFVVQGGGFTYDGTGDPEDIPTHDPIQNEPGISNLRGTIAMAKIGDDPNSATSQWFFNLGDNSANLDNQNGGFTVFGEVFGDGMDIIDDIAALPVLDMGGDFTTLPVTGYESGSILLENLVMFDSISPLENDAFLTYTATSDNPSLVAATIDENNQLILQYTPNLGGTAQVTIRATDDSGAFVETTIDIVVNDRPDLVVNFGRVTLPNRPAVGDRGIVQLLVTNQEPFTATGVMDLQLWASRDGDITNENGDDYLLTTLTNQRINLRQNRTASYTANFNMPGNLDAGEYQLVAVVDSGEAIAERYEDNNTAVYATQTYGIYAPHVDLTGRITRLTVRNNVLTVGDKGSVHVTVTNEGNQAANGQMNLSLFSSSSHDIATHGVPIGALNNVRVVLAAGQSRTFRVPFTINEDIPSGGQWLYAIVDADNRIAEAGGDLGYDPEANNTTPVPGQDPSDYYHHIRVQRPDLRARVYQTNLSAAPLAGERAWARIAVTNYNFVRAKGKANVQLWLRPKDTRYQDVLLAQRNNYGINLRGYYSSRITLRFQMPNTLFDTETQEDVLLPQGEYQLVANVTPTSPGLLEDDPTNNETATGSYQVRESFMDLTARITRRIIRNNPSTEGDSVQLHVTIANNGNSTVRARGVRVNVWASTDRDVNDEDGQKYLLATKAVNLGLAPDRTMKTAFSFRLPGLDVLPANDYYLVAEVDGNNNVLEATGDETFDAEDNNTHSIANGLRIGQPDLAGLFQTISLPTNVVSGATGRATLNVYNIGTVRGTGRYNVTLYASRDDLVDVGEDIVVGEVVHCRFNLRPNRMTRVNVPVDTTGLDGNYKLLAVLDSGDTIGESNEDNNVVVSGPTYNVQAAHVDLVGTLGMPIVANPGIGGAPIRIPLRIVNNGNAPIRQKINVEFRAAGGVNASLGTLENYNLSLAPGQARTVFYRSVLPYVAEAQTYHVEADIDSGNAVAEGLPGGVDAEANNTAVSNQDRIVNAAFVNLVGTLTTPVVSALATTGDRLRTGVVIANGGNVNYAGRVNIAFKANGQVLHTVENYRLVLRPGQARTVPVTTFLPAGLEAGTHNVVVEITEVQDQGHVKTQANDTAGVGALNVGSANLVAALLNTPLTGTVIETTTHTARIQLANTGDVRYQGPAGVKLYATSDGVIDGTGDFELATLPIGPLNLQPGQSGTYTLDFTLPNGMDDTATYQLATVIDTTQGLGAEIGGDNTAVAPPQFNVEDASVDLTVTAVWPPAPYGQNNEIFLRGETYSMQVTVTNDGNLPAGAGEAFYTSLYCAHYDTQVAVDENMLLGEFALQDLAPGASVTQTLNFMFPNAFTSDNYNLRIFTDSGQDVAEDFENNNGSSTELYFMVGSPT